MVLNSNQRLGLPVCSNPWEEFMGVALQQGLARGKAPQGAEFVAVREIP